MDDFKQQLIQLLKTDDEIRRLIAAVAMSCPTDSTNEDNLKQKIMKLEKILEWLKKKLGIKENDDEQLKMTVDKLINKVDDYKKEIAYLKNKLNKNNEKTVECNHLFKEQIATYEQFNTLSEQTKKSLAGIFKDNSIMGFIACGVQEKSIHSLWDYLKHEVIENKNNDLPKLKSIFYFLFFHYRLSYPMYNLQDVILGAEFDTQNHIKHSSSSNVSGSIQEVVLKGWVNEKTGKVIKQSVVKI